MSFDVIISSSSGNDRDLKTKCVPENDVAFILFNLSPESGIIKLFSAKRTKLCCRTCRGLLRLAQVIFSAIHRYSHYDIVPMQFIGTFHCDKVPMHSIGTLQNDIVPMQCIHN